MTPSSSFLRSSYKPEPTPITHSAHPMAFVKQCYETTSEASTDDSKISGLGSTTARFVRRVGSGILSTFEQHNISRRLKEISYAVCEFRDFRRLLGCPDELEVVLEDVLELTRRSHCSNMTKAGYPKDVVSRASSSIHCILNHCACVSWSTDIPSHVHEQLLNFIYNVYWTLEDENTITGMFLKILQTIQLVQRNAELKELHRKFVCDVLPLMLCDVLAIYQKSARGIGTMKDDNSPDFIKIWDSSLGAILFDYRDELDVRRHVGRAFNCLCTAYAFDSPPPEPGEWDLRQLLQSVPSLDRFLIPLREEKSPGLGCGGTSKSAAPPQIWDTGSFASLVHSYSDSNSLASTWGPRVVDPDPVKSTVGTWPMTNPTIVTVMQADMPSVSMPTKLDYGDDKDRDKDVIPELDNLDVGKDSCVGKSGTTTNASYGGGSLPPLSWASIIDPQLGCARVDQNSSSQYGPSPNNGSEYMATMAIARDNVPLSSLEEVRAMPPPVYGQPVDTSDEIGDVVCLGMSGIESPGGLYPRSGRRASGSARVNTRVQRTDGGEVVDGRLGVARRDVGMMGPDLGAPLLRTITHRPLPSPVMDVSMSQVVPRFGDYGNRASPTRTGDVPASRDVTTIVNELVRSMDPSMVVILSLSVVPILFMFSILSQSFVVILLFMLRT